MAKELIDIEKLVRWALAEQQVDCAAVGSDNVLLGYASGQRAMEQAHEYGQLIQDGVVERLIAQSCHIDAFTTYDAILSLPVKARDMVLFNGKLRQRPDWCEAGAGKRVARIGRFGRPATITLPNGEKQVIYDWDGVPPHEVKRMRAAYVVWWEGLSALAAHLEKSLEDYIPHSPRVSREPWAIEEKKVG